MMKQTGLFGNVSESKSEKRGSSKSFIDDVCCSACYLAQEDKCNCKCQGKYHGLGNPRNKRQKILVVDEGDKVLPEEEAREFRKQYINMYCICGEDLSEEPIQYYTPHSGGWTIKCESEKAWLFIKCPKCHYDMSLWKLGVRRE